MATATVTNAPLIQGVALTPDYVVDPLGFYANTRRQRFYMQSPKTILGVGSSDQITLRQTGIVSQLEVRIYGNVVFGGTIGTTTMSNYWPYKFVKAFQLSANGQSTLINADGLMTRAGEFPGNSDISDRGVGRTWSGGTTDAATQGTLSLSCDDWGTSSSNRMAPNTNVAAVGTYTVDLTFLVPVAADQTSLIGSILAQSASTNLNLTVQYAAQSEVIAALGGSATVSFAGLNIEVTGVVYSIPNVNGKYLIPDLTQFHSFTQFMQPGLAQGQNEAQLPGVGTGRKLLRALFQVWTGSTPAPLAMTDANYSITGWSYGGATIPEQYAGGSQLRAANERMCNTDLGKLWGIGLWDFASQYALRDVVDEGATANLRLLLGLVSAPTAGFANIAQENLFSGVVGA
jgi:hypothetical protein